eukprot:scaffold12149_cov16-Tisochrysis_lutea.AAC.7
MGAMAALLQNAASSMGAAGSASDPAALSEPLPSWLTAGLTAAAAFQEETAAALAAKQRQQGDHARMVAEGLLGQAGVGGSRPGSLGGSGTASPGGYQGRQGGDLDPIQKPDTEAGRWACAAIDVAAVLKSGMDGCACDEDVPPLLGFLDDVACSPGCGWQTAPAA